MSMAFSITKEGHVDNYFEYSTMGLLSIKLLVRKPR
jgi:hypothetical protein